MDKLRSIISDTKGTLQSISSLPLPLDPTKKVCGVVAEKSGIFNSNLQPLRLTFVCDDDSEYPVSLFF